MAVPKTPSVKWAAARFSQSSRVAGPAPVIARPRRLLRTATMPVTASKPCPAMSPTTSSTFLLGSKTVSYQSPLTRLPSPEGRYLAATSSPAASTSSLGAADRGGAPPGHQAAGGDHPADLPYAAVVGA